MLKHLRHIVQEVNACDDFKEAMRILVHRVRETMATQACSIFLLDGSKEHYILMASDGLNSDMIGRLRLQQDQGLVGLVGQRVEPLNISNAPSHPHFLLCNNTGEERFKAFLGVPIIYQRQLLGVIIVQQIESRAFDESEEAFLVTMSAQLARVIAHATATGKLARAITHYHDNSIEVTELQGIPSVPGVGMGQAIVVYPHAELNAIPDRKPDNIENEINTLKQALQNTRNDIIALGERMKDVLPESEQALFDVYRRILDDESLGQELIAEIKRGHWAQAALRNVIQLHLQQFDNMQDAYLRERADDLRDLGQRVLAHLQVQQHQKIDYHEHTILLGEEITPSALAEVPQGMLAGIVSVRGSKNSHVAILARALSIPTVMGVQGLDLAEAEHQNIIVNGYSGQVYLRPSEQLQASFTELMIQEDELTASLEQLRDLPAQTPDGQYFSLFINTGLNDDAGLSLSVGAEGIGLYRTEVPFMLRDAFPVEEEQRIIYKQLLTTFAPRPVIMRTLDVGGDKALPYFPINEENPFLGWRGLRISLDHPDMFLVQLRAMLRANQDLGNLRIMFPMISHVGELDEALRLLHKAHEELTQEGCHVPMPLLGAMVEVPSAVYQARDIAKRVDFLSVGSNDLIQYLLAVDRNNPRVAELYDGLHPAVLKALQQTVEFSHQEGKHTSICGEMAGDPVAVLLLMGMGFDALSMSTTHLPRIKWVIRNFTREQAQVLLKEVLLMDNPIMIRFHLEQALETAGLGGLIRAGK